MDNGKSEIFLRLKFWVHGEEKGKEWWWADGVISLELASCGVMVDVGAQENREQKKDEKKRTKAEQTKS
ncbi:hypothetical protein ACFX13_029459 [Malus domestica]